MVSLVVRGGGFLARKALSRDRLGRFSRFVRGAGFKSRLGSGTKAVASTIGLGAAFEFGASLARPPAPVIRIPERSAPMPNFPVRRAPQPPMRRDVVVTPGPVPVQFVKQWQACAALFGIDDQGHRWVWRPKLGIWKRIRVTRNIVISGKDVRRARRLVAVSKRLNKLRAKIR